MNRARRRFAGLAMLALCAVSPVFSQSGVSPAPLPSAPADVQPGSITYEGIPYPYPVSYFILSPTSP